jgi:3-oxoacyl-[acyl-carrier protein] reductase
MDFTGQRAVVTGASRGIGRATVRALVAQGAGVAALARSGEELAALRTEVQAHCAELVTEACDVADPAAVERAIAAAAGQLGGIDILVNNAGITPDRAPVGEGDPQPWIATIQTNLIGAYLCAHYTMPHLRRSPHGRIINLGSAMRGAHRTGASAYDCSKAALWKFTQVLALEARDAGIDVNEVIPGPVATAMSPGWRAGQAVPDLPGERVKTPEEVADFILWVLSFPKGGPTGQVFSLARRPF